MSGPAAKPSLGLFKWALWGAAAVGVAAVVYIMVQSSTKPQDAAAPARAPADARASGFEKLAHVADGSPPPPFRFNDAAGRSLTLADLKGQVVVANLWATWCAPCRLEMPQLAKLQARYEGRGVVVAAISIDKPEQLAEARAFIAGQKPLAFYNDPTAKFPWALKPEAQGVPTTVIYGRDGLERGRVSGEADWSSPAVGRWIDRLLAE